MWKYMSYIELVRVAHSRVRAGILTPEDTFDIICNSNCSWQDVVKSSFT